MKYKYTQNKKIYMIIIYMSISISMIFEYIVENFE